MKKHGSLYNEIDQDLEPFSFMMEALTSIVDAQESTEDLWKYMKLDQINFDFPIEMEVHVSDDGSVTLGSAPPTQRIETSFMPVIQSTKITVVPLEELYGEE